jgi:hypothetical protein
VCSSTIPVIRPLEGTVVISPLIATSAALLLYTAVAWLLVVVGRRVRRLRGRRPNSLGGRPRLPEEVKP